MTRKGRSSYGGQARTCPTSGGPTTCSIRWPWPYAGGPKELSLVGRTRSETLADLPCTGPTLSRMTPSPSTLCSKRPWDSNLALCAGSSHLSGWSKSCAASPPLYDHSTGSWPRVQGWYRQHRGPTNCGQSSPRCRPWRRGSAPARTGSCSGSRSSRLLRFSASEPVAGQE